MANEGLFFYGGRAKVPYKRGGDIKENAFKEYKGVKSKIKKNK